LEKAREIAFFDTLVAQSNRHALIKMKMRSTRSYNE